MQKLKIYLLIYLKTAGIFFSTFAVLFGIIYGSIQYSKYLKQKKALEQIAEKPQTLPLVDNAVQDYLSTAQTWFVPNYNVLLSPMNWLSDTENCILSTRLNEMKFAGLVPKHYTIKDFVQHFTSKELYGKFGLHVWDKTLDDKILAEINQRMNKDSEYQYKWISLSSMDELIYLAKRKQHVLVGVTIWMAPNKYHKEPLRYRNSPISHAITITGIKSYDPKEDRIEFEISDPLPFNWINYIPAYSKVHPNGYNLFKRQAVPYVVKNGRAKSGYIVRELKKEPKKNSTLTLKNNNKNSNASRSF